jgi:hypothetical protein
MNRKLFRALTASAVLVASMMISIPLLAKAAAVDVATLTKSPNGIYIVQMIGDPVVAYKGDVKGLKATKPPRGKKIDPNSPAVVRYVDYLAGKHDAALARVGGGQKVYDYYYSLNGFAARLSLDQAKALATDANVSAVAPDQVRTMDTATTPDFLGLTDPGGLWDQLGGVGSAGEDIIIGIIDSGIWPESASFSDRTGYNGNGRKGGKLSYQQIPGWHGKCVPGEAFPASKCNQKLIGAQYFNEGYGGDAGIAADRPWEFTSPRDYNGHGSHTASTAGGNNGVSLPGPAALFGSASGMAPRARIAAYKALWSNEDASQSSGFTGDLVAAIDQAVADGVDVINYSISGTSTNFADAAEIAFLFAADAGVCVAAPAGNSGPGASTVAHPSPWITTVAASTHDRNYSADVVLGDGSSYTGASANTTGAGPADLVYSANVGLGEADPTEVRLCYPGTLDPAQVAGKIVLCDRGTIARVDKSLAVYMAGGVGTILANVSPSSLNADFHSVPTVHVDEIDGAAIRTYATGGGTPTAQIFPAYSDPIPAPYIAGFSSRGPLLAGEGDLLKPDVSAPGVDIVAAVAPPGNGGLNFASYSGTSMSSPHVAGLGALLKDLHPDWSPMMIKSALMTTGYDLLSGADPFAQGAGHVDPNSAADPGLVFNHGWNEWLAFLCGTTSAVGSGTCGVLESLGYSLDPSDLNVASVAIGALAGVQTVTRTVTNVSNVPEYYEFGDSVAGVDVTADPPNFTLNPGASQTVELTLANNDAPINTYATGSVAWTGDEGHVVRIPVAVTPVAIAAPAEVAGSGTDGSLSFDITFGYTGAYTAAAHGLEAATTEEGNVVQDPDQSFDPNDGYSTLHVIDVPAGTAFTRFSLFDEYTDGDDDLDLYVYCPDFSYCGGSGSGTSAEQVNVAFPAPGSYYVLVHGWGTDGPDANYTLFSWSVSATPGGGLSIDDAPAAATLGTTDNVDVSWAGLGVDMKYLGAVSHSDGGLIGLTLISVDTD